MKKSELQSLYESLCSELMLNPGTARDILKTTGRGGTSANRDYVQACCLLSEVRKSAAYSAGALDLTECSESDLWSVLDAATRFRLRAYTPCLAARYDELKESAQKEIFEDQNWIFTSKENGVRGWLVCLPDGTFKIFSRNYSDVDCSLLEYSGNVLQSVRDHDDVFAIDCEIMFAPGVDISADLEQLGLSTDSQLDAMVALLHLNSEQALDIQRKFKQIYARDLIEFRLIAPLYFKGKNFVTRTLGEGMDAYNDCALRAQELGLNVKVIKRCAGDRTAKENFLNSILNAGGEGVVAHYRLGSYCTSEARSKTSFVKIKRSISASENALGMGDEIDGWVSGFKVGNLGTVNEGYVASLEFSIYLQEPDGSMHPHKIAVVPGIDKSLRESATVHDASGLYPTEYIGSDNEVHVISLNPMLDRVVAEISGQALSPCNQRMEHPRIVRWRAERSAESCIYSRAFIDANTTSSFRNKSAGITYAQSSADAVTGFEVSADELPF